MIVDSSAIVAIFQQEPGYEKLIDLLAEESAPGIGTPTLVETGIVLSARMRRNATGHVGRLMQEFGLVEVPFGDMHWRTAVDAWLRFGKGRHAAALNFGDCMSYATAFLADEPLLFTGSDFDQTDIVPALPVG